MSESARMSVLVLTEDSAKHAIDVLKAMTTELLRLVDPQLQLRFIRIDPSQLGAAVHGSSWHTLSHKSSVDLCKAIATQLQQQTGFVIHHFDADEPWSKRKGIAQGKYGRMEASIRSALTYNLAPLPERRLGKRNPPAANQPPEAKLTVEQAMAHLFQAIPHHEIEAWLYQNTVEGKAICSEEHSDNAKHLEQFDEWAADRKILDDIRDTKDHYCLGAEFNLRLATEGFPAREVLKADMSFADLKKRLAACDDLKAALKLTYPQYEANEQPDGEESGGAT